MKIVGFSSLDKTLLLFPPVKAFSLSGELSLSLGTKSCIGRWEGETYLPCESPEWPTCSSCREFNPCAVCSGACLKDEKTCLEAHAVYVAMFRPNIFKIGVAKASRFHDRLREQGADIAAVVEYAPDGELARRKERELQQYYGIRGNVRYSQKQQIDTELDSDAWHTRKARLNAYDEVKLDYFNEQPWMRPLHVRDVLLGRVIGLKGRLLILEKDATLYSFDLNDALGAEISPINVSKRQMSLNSF
ncbi:MAG: DUF2797 domain-containing protein [Halobacteriota archaeon]